MKINDECEHDKCTTDFCPHCGLEMHTGALGELLRYLKTQVSRAVRDRDDLISDTADHWRARKEKIVKRWERWRDAVAKVVQQ